MGFFECNILKVNSLFIITCTNAMRCTMQQNFVDASLSDSSPSLNYVHVCVSVCVCVSESARVYFKPSSGCVHIGVHFHNLKIEVASNTKFDYESVFYFDNSITPIKFFAGIFSTRSPEPIFAI